MNYVKTILITTYKEVTSLLQKCVVETGALQCWDDTVHTRMRTEIPGVTLRPNKAKDGTGKVTVFFPETFLTTAEKTATITKGEIVSDPAVFSVDAAASVDPVAPKPEAPADDVAAQTPNDVTQK